MVTIPGVSHVAMIHSSWCPLTRTCLRARTHAGSPCQWRSQALSLRQDKMALAGAVPPCNACVPARRFYANMARSPRCFIQWSRWQGCTGLTSCRKRGIGQIDVHPRCLITYVWHILSRDGCCLHRGCAEAWLTSRRKPSSSWGED